MKPKYTPGPWAIHKFGEHIVTANGKFIAELTESNGDRVQCQSPRIKTNARLIALAPTMANFLSKHEKSLINFFDSLEGPFSDTKKELQDILKKINE